MEPLELEEVRIGRRLRELALVKPTPGSRRHGRTIERGPADWPYRRRLPTGASDSSPHAIGVGRYVGPTSTWVTRRQAASPLAWHIEAPRPRGRRRLVYTACGQVWGISATMPVERRGDVDSIRRAERCPACQALLLDGTSSEALGWGRPWDRS